MVAGLDLDGGSLLAYAVDVPLGEVLTVLGLDLYRRYILLGQPHADALPPVTASHTPSSSSSAAAAAAAASPQWTAHLLLRFPTAVVPCISYVRKSFFI